MKASLIGAFSFVWGGVGFWAVAPGSQFYFLGLWWWVVEFFFLFFFSVMDFIGDFFEKAEELIALRDIPAKSHEELKLDIKSVYGDLWQYRSFRQWDFEFDFVQRNVAAIATLTSPGRTKYICVLNPQKGLEAAKTVIGKIRPISEQKEVDAEVEDIVRKYRPIDNPFFRPKGVDLRSLQALGGVQR